MLIVTVISCVAKMVACGVALVLAIFPVLCSAWGPNDIRTVHVVQGCHLDVVGTLWVLVLTEGVCQQCCWYH